VRGTVDEAGSEIQAPEHYVVVRLAARRQHLPGIMAKAKKDTKAGGDSAAKKKAEKKKGGAKKGKVTKRSGGKKKAGAKKAAKKKAAPKKK